MGTICNRFSAESGQVSPGSDERLLDRVARELRVAEDQAGCRVQPREVHVEERGEGVMLASPRSLDQASLVPGRPCFGTATAVVLDRVWRPCRPKGSTAAVSSVPTERAGGHDGRGDGPGREDRQRRHDARPVAERGSERVGQGARG